MGLFRGSRERDPEMKQTRKGKQWHLGMKLHVGVDDQSGLVHSLATTSANRHDLTASEQLLHGEEVRGWEMQVTVEWRSGRPIRMGLMSHSAETLQTSLGH